MRVYSILLGDGEEEEEETICKGVEDLVENPHALLFSHDSTTLAVAEVRARPPGPFMRRRRAGRGRGRGRQQSIKGVHPESGSDDDVSPIIGMAADNGWTHLSTLSMRSEVRVYDLASKKAHFVVPMCSAPVTSIGFSPSSTLVVCCADNNFHLWNVSKKTRVEVPDVKEDLHRRRTAVKGIAFNPAKRDAVILYAQDFMCSVDFSKDSARHGVMEKWRPIFFASSVADNEMLVVETPWLDILRAMLSPMARKQYTT